MSHEEFKEFIRHHTETYREDKERKETLDADLRRKLLHMQLEEHMESEKAVQAPVVAETSGSADTTQTDVRQPMPKAAMTPLGQLPHPTPKDSSVQQTLLALIQLQLQQQQCDSSRGGGQSSGRGRGQGGPRQRACYVCGGTDHLARECPRNVFNRTKDQGAESQIQLASQKVPQGPTNLEASWGSQFQ